MLLDSRHAGRNRHAHKAAAVVERVVADAAHAVGNRHARKAAAPGERAAPDARHAIADCHARKPSAVEERVPPDARHGVRYRHARQAAAASERMRPNAQHAVGNSHVLYQGAVEIQVVRVIKRIGRGTAKGNAAPLREVVNAHACQPVAAQERKAPDARHAVGNRHARKAAAVVERVVPDARHAVGNRHARKAAAAEERVNPDARHGTAAERGGDGDCASRGIRNRRVEFVEDLRLAVADGIGPCNAVHGFHVGRKRHCDGERGCAREQFFDGDAVHLAASFPWFTPSA